MEEYIVCNICSRRFSNGKAMGGHMRSHLALLPVPPKIPSSHAEIVPPVSLNNFKSIDSDDQSTESDTESSPDKPSKMARTLATSEPKVALGREAEVAMSLIMLSKDSWAKKGKMFIKNDVKTDDDDDDSDDDGEDDDSEDALFDAHKRSRSKYKCETCKKVFKSYQALGGHRASHKKVRTRLEDEEKRGRNKDLGGRGCSVKYQNRRAFKCSFCDKVFESGQALGGHKKVHYSSNATNSIPKSSTSTGTNSTSTSTTTNFRDSGIDLNLPAPEEDDED